MKAVNIRDSLFNVCTATVLTARPSQYFDCSGTILELQTHRASFYFQFDKFEVMLAEEEGRLDTWISPNLVKVSHSL